MRVAPLSESEALSVPVMELVPAKVVPLLRLPDSVSKPLRAVKLLVTDGTSLVPLIVTVMD